MLYRTSSLVEEIEGLRQYFSIHLTLLRYQLTKLAQSHKFPGLWTQPKQWLWVYKDVLLQRLHGKSAASYVPNPVSQIPR